MTAGKLLVGRHDQPVREAVDGPVAIPRRREVTDALGHRWSIAAAGLAVEHPSGERVVYDRASGLPFGHLTCLDVAPGGDVWIGSKYGLLRLTGGAFEVYAGGRWLPGDQVLAVRCAADREILVRTVAGDTRLVLRSMSLREKADWYEALTDARHRRGGYVTGCGLARPGDLTSWQSRCDDNDGLWTAMYLAAEAFRHAVTGEEEARRKALDALEAILDLERRSGIDGFPARSLCHRSEPRFHNQGDGEWHDCADGEWEWKADTSSDELDGHYFAWGIAYDLVAGPAEREAIAEVCRRVTDHLHDHGWYLVDLDGRPTRWGVFAPERLNDDPRWFAERGLNSLELLGYLKTAAHVTGDAKYEAYARELIEREHYALNTVEQKVMPGDFAGAECNHSDDELAWLSYYSLLRYETDPALRAVYLAGFERSWRIERPEACPLWNFMYGALAGRPCDLEAAVGTLRDIPLDLIDHPMRNSHRWDVELAGDPDRFGRVEGRRPVSFRERPQHKWNGNPYLLDGGGGTSEECGTFWLLPYWLGRYHGLIDEAP